MDSSDRPFEIERLDPADLLEHLRSVIARNASTVARTRALVARTSALLPEPLRPQADRDARG